METRFAQGAAFPALGAFFAGLARGLAAIGTRVWPFFARMFGQTNASTVLAGVTGWQASNAWDWVSNSGFGQMLGLDDAEDEATNTFLTVFATVGLMTVLAAIGWFFYFKKK